MTGSKANLNEVDERLILSIYEKAENIRKVAAMLGLGYYKTWSVIAKHGVAHRIDKPRKVPILTDRELTPRRIRVNEELYLEIVPVKPTTELLWALGHALGDGTHTIDSFRLLGSPKVLPAQRVIDAYVSSLAKTFTKGKYALDWFKWDPIKQNWVKVDNPNIADKWQIRLESRLLARIYRAIRKSCEFTDVLARNWEAVIAGLYDSDGYQKIYRGKWLIISQSIGEKLDAILQFLNEAQFNFRIWKGGTKKPNDKINNIKPNYHLAIEYNKSVEAAIQRYSLRTIRR